MSAADGGRRPGPLHRAVLVDGPEDAGDRAAEVLTAAARRRRRPLVAVLRPSVATRARTRLAATVTAGVSFLPLDVDRSPSAIARDHLDARSGGQRPTVVTEVVPELDPYATGCLREEVRADRDLRGDAERTCLCPRDDPFARVARLTHPVVREDGRDRANPDYRGLRLLRAEPALADLDPGGTVHQVVPHLDPDLRAWLGRRARDAGLGDDLVDQLVLATHEALRTGAESRTPTRPGTGRLEAGAPGPDGVSTTRLYLHPPDPRVADDPDGLPGLVVDVDAAWLPDPEAGRLPDDPVAGLWFARAACRDLDVTVHPLTATTSRIRIVAPPAR